MRLLYLTEEPIPVSETAVRGGVIHVKRVVAGLRDRGHDVHLLDWQSDSDATFHHTVRPIARVGVGAVQTYRAAVRLARTHDIDAIISKTRKTYAPGFLAARRVDVPHLVHVGSSLDPPTDSVLDRINKRSFSSRLSLPHDGYLVVCGTIRQELRERGVQGRIFEVGNAVDTDAFHPAAAVPTSDSLETALGSNPDEFRLAFVGGLHDYKGVFDLAAALSRLDGCHLFVAGDGPARDPFEREVGSDATFLGSVPYESVPAVFRAVDALVLPSHTEGLPRVLLESMAMKTPVVATRVGGIPEVVEHEKTGLLCASHDPYELATQIDRLASDSDLGDRLATNGRRRVSESFTWDALFDRYEHALETVLDRDG